MRYTLCVLEVSSTRLYHTMYMRGDIAYMYIGIGAALSQLGWWSGTFLMGEIGPILLSSSLKTLGTFYLFAGMYSLAALHVLFFLPETKVQWELYKFQANLTKSCPFEYDVQGRSLESIQWLFSEPWSRRVNVFYYIRYQY